MELSDLNHTLRLAGLKHWGKQWLKGTVSPLLDQAGWFDSSMNRLTESTWSVVLYHRITPQADPGLLSAGMCVSAKNFEAQMAYFRQHFNPIRMDQAVARLMRGEPLPPRAVSVTFDDGYVDNLEVAWPVLQRYQMPASLFVPTGGLACGEPFWWDRVGLAFSATADRRFNGAEFGLPGWDDRPLSLGFGQRESVLRQVIDTLWRMSHHEVVLAVAAIERRLLQHRRLSRGAMRLPARMTAQQVREMHQRGIEIAAHSVHHPNLEQLTPGEVVAEVVDSRRALESLCQTAVRGFAYPAGFLNAEVARAVESTGLDYAVTTDAGVNHPSTGRFQLQRVGMPDDGVADFKRAFIGAVERSAARGAALGATLAPAR